MILALPLALAALLLLKLSSSLAPAPSLLTEAQWAEMTESFLQASQ